jgi:Rrf2 family nitric oxide-sensitive transcriptional repressor
MRLSLQTDYALRTLMYLASKKAGKRGNIADVAGFFDISEAHVAKVVNQLARLGFVRSVRGVGGGIELGRDPSQIRLGEVILAFEGNLHLLECVGTDNVCVIQDHCKLRTVLAKAERLQFEYLKGVRLADLLPV